MDIDQEIQETLNDIVEIGYVQIRDGRVTSSEKPIDNVCSSRWDRWSPTVQYLRDYAHFHEDFGGEFFVCLYDGWREYSEPALGAERTYVQWRDLPQKSSYIGTGNAGERRFRHNADDFSIYPELPLKVLTYNRHLDDRNALLIPDSEFLENGFRGFLDSVNHSDISWNQKKNVFVWRGSPNRDQGLMYYDHGIGLRHPRELAVQLSQSRLGNNFDAAYGGGGGPAWMLGHKFILDIDGMVNAWSGLYWKLYSNSAVVKMKSHWEQWYYDKLVPYKHYIPITSFWNIPRAAKWCKHNDAKCAEIANSGKDLVATLTYDYAIKEYMIR